MASFNWLKRSAQNRIPHFKAQDGLDRYLNSDGVFLQAHIGSDVEPISIPEGSIVAVSGNDGYKKNLLCDWMMGFCEIQNASLTFRSGERAIRDPADRKQYCTVLGRSPLLVGESIQEAILYRTQDVRKADLYHFIETMYGTSLRNKTNPQNPLLDKNNKIIPIQILTAREHLEVAQINVMLARIPMVVFDLSSAFMQRAVSEGFKPSRTLLESGKTILVILPEGTGALEAEAVLGMGFHSHIQI